ncbi:PREDICTED: major facilitator superfamily domain-containing protein 6-like [Vollenhovia emeryi]|uniref:major facilitator superfamily domain-containing protein 6-like n=1 Tax=Vollenhovia emeryi TaxID=411798 RepID=UPI0005F37D0C|nr:PREDICTED: major facilitator superfamily domain-containing protein 6-like [Vollenhovia emeryi]
MKINYAHLLVKVHYFFYVGSVGPILPFLSVYGKQIGISPLIIGSIAAILPILYLTAKPIFGFIMDYFEAWRKIIYLSLYIIAHTCFIMIVLLPPLPGVMPLKYHFQNITCVTLPHCNINYHASAIRSCNGTKDATCHWTCKDHNFSMQLSFHGDQKKVIISPDTTCLLNINQTSMCQGNVTNYNCNVSCDDFNDDQCLYKSFTFWSFAVLMCLGECAIYVFISLTTTICLGILGEGKRLKFGKLRLWGTIGFGITACLTGYMIDLWSQEEVYKMYTPSLFLMIIFASIDIICCIRLKLPFESTSTTILKDVFTLLKSKSIIVFLCFVTFVGTLNSILRNFVFWYLEDLAIKTGYMGNIKLIEGLIIAVRTFGGEILFFFISGKMLQKFGYDYTITFSLICYALRLGLITLAPTPWWVLGIEFLQGPTYALSFVIIALYANEATPSGAAATVQGLVFGLQDGFGLLVGSLGGGFLYKTFGGIITLRIFSVLAALAALIYFILYTLYLKHKTIGKKLNHLTSQHTTYLSNV